MSLPADLAIPLRPGLRRGASNFGNIPASPIIPSPFIPASAAAEETEYIDGVLELADGSAYRGLSFGAEGKSISGECVFQTGAQPNFFLL